MRKYKIHFITYSDKKFEKQKKFTTRIAKLFGFKSITAYGPDDIDNEFRLENDSILSNPRGGGYWLWKPYFVNKKLDEIPYGEYVLYMDSGAFLVKSPELLIKSLLEVEQDILGFELPLIEKQWTKPQVFDALHAGTEQIKDSNQINGAFQLIRKSCDSIGFYREYLQHSTDELLITDLDMPNTDNYYGFIDHRHDQSIFSVLFKKHGLKGVGDPSQYGQYPELYTLENKLKYKKGVLYKTKGNRLFRVNHCGSELRNVIFHNRGGRPIRAWIKFNLNLLKSFF